MLTPQWLDELRARTTLSSVILRTDKLTRAGREWKGCCPFHQEKTPSFTVNDDKGFYHCFGCGAHGDVIRWMTDQRGLQFMDAVKELAALAGMEVPAPDPRAARQAEKRASLHDVCQAAQDWFVANLRSDAGTDARRYLATRGFKDAVIAQFGFGYAPQDRQAMKQALAQFPEEMLIEAGLRIQVDDKEPYDRFRSRLMLPIHDARGRVIAFGGRILDANSNAPKYLNSPDTPLFDKGRNLYNYHRAGPASRQSGRLIVVEGYMDVIALANAGIEDAVAPMGTALTEHQIELLWRQVEAPILCFDGDNAGQNAAMRAIGRALPMLRPSHSLQIVRMPEGMDPDDLIAQQGKSALEAHMGNAASLIETLWKFEALAQPLATPEAKAGLKARLITHIEAIQHPDIAALYRRELMDKFSAFAFPKHSDGGVPRPATRSSSGRWPSRNAAPPNLSADAAQRLKRVTSHEGKNDLFSAVMHGLIQHPGEISKHEETLSTYANLVPSAAKIIDILLNESEKLENGEKTAISKPEGLAMPPDEHRFPFLDKGIDPHAAHDALAEAISLLVERPALNAALKAATARFETDPEGAFAEQQRLLKQKLDFERRVGVLATNRAAQKAKH